MSAGLVFSYEDGDANPRCDICGMSTTTGAFLVHRERRPGIALFVSCVRCQVELACLVVREFWPSGIQPPDPDPPPDTSQGGGSSC